MTWLLWYLGQAGASPYRIKGQVDTQTYCPSPPLSLRTLDAHTQMRPVCGEVPPHTRGVNPFFLHVAAWIATSEGVTYGPGNPLILASVDLPFVPLLRDIRGQPVGYTWHVHMDRDTSITRAALTYYLNRGCYPTEVRGRPWRRSVLPTAPAHTG